MQAAIVPIRQPLLRGPQFDTQVIRRARVDDPADKPRYARWRTESAEQLA